MIVIPELPADADNLTAALAYAAAGLYVGPARRGSKHPGSIVGDQWQHHSSRDPEQIAAWFAGSDHDLWIHAGRSGLLIADVDKPGNVPEPLDGHLPSAPFHASRPAIEGYGHYLFAQPEGVTLGNGLGKLSAGRDGSAWGQIRGRNGVIMAFPSVHIDGGEYRWLRTGPVPVVPDDVVEALLAGRPPSDGEPAETATDAEVEAFVAEHSTATRPGALDGRVKGFAKALADGRGRHDSLVAWMRGCMEEACLGYYSAQAAIDALWPLFRDAVAVGPKGRSESRARAEFYSVLAYAVAQAALADPDVVRERVEDALGVDGEAAFEDVLRNAAKGSKGEQPTAEAAQPAGPRVWRADELAESAALEWLGVKHIPESAVTLLTGDEGIGKSLLWVYIVAAVTTGSALPELGIPEREPRHALVIVTEDDWASTVRPRLELAGADMDYVSVLCSEPDGSGSPYFPRDIGIVLSTVPRPYLVVLDAWADTVEGHLSVRDGQQARVALHPWREVATRLRAAVLLLTHTNRDGGTSIRARYALTSELRKKARMALFAQQGEDGNLVVGPDKSNLVGKVPAVVFSIEAAQVFEPTESSDGTVPQLVYVETADYTAADLLAESAAPPAREGAEGFAQITLATILANGQAHDRAEVIEKLAAVGIPESTGKRAADKLGIIKERRGFQGGSTWRLPISSPNQPSVSDEPNDPNELNGPNTGPPASGPRLIRRGAISSVSSFSSPQTDGPNGEPNDTVEKRDDLDPNGWPYCAGGCGLGVNPAITDGDRHGFCS